jgi:hypothetical protein
MTLLARTLADCRAALGGAGEPATAVERDVTDELIGQLDARAGGDDLAATMLAVAGGDEDRRAALADVAGRAARRLAPDDRPPETGEAAESWRALVLVLDSIYGNGAVPLRRLDFIGERLVELLAREARMRLPQAVAGRRTVGAPGSALASVAASGSLRRALSSALDEDIVPSGSAVYLYDPPGSHVRTHVDSRGYEFVFHLILEHEVPPDTERPGGSALIVHRPGMAEPERVSLNVGEAVALRGRGSIHSWERLSRGERRTLIGIGFERA